MKKLLIFIMGVVLVFTMAGCSVGVGNVTGTADGQLVTEEDLKQQEEEASANAEKENITDEDFEDNLAGLESYFKKLGIIAEDASKIEMDASFIGAKEGIKYTFSYTLSEKNSVNISMELYEFDLENLDQAGESTIQSVKEKGSFIILNNEVKATLSNSGKYLMIYTDNGSADNEENNMHKEEVNKRFQEFKS